MQKLYECLKYLYYYGGFQDVYCSMNTCWELQPERRSRFEDLEREFTQFFAAECPQAAGQVVKMQIYT